MSTQPAHSHLKLFKYRHFEIPNHPAVRARWYLRYSLSYRDLEEMMAERDGEIEVAGPNLAGGYFTFVGRQVRVEVNRQEYFIYLFFYHRKAAPARRFGADGVP